MLLEDALGLGCMSKMNHIGLDWENIGVRTKEASDDGLLETKGKRCLIYFSKRV